MSRIWFVLYITMAFLWGTACMAHGVKHTLFEGAFGIEVRYDDNTPMRYSEVNVFSPSDKETAFQQGFTDKNGRFSFFPDTNGMWRMAVDDGMGHAVSEDIEIKEGMTLVRKNSPRFSRFQGIIVGVSVIVGLFGLSSLFLPWRLSR